MSGLFPAYTPVQAGLHILFQGPYLQVATGPFPRTMHGTFSKSTMGSFPRIPLLVPFPKHHGFFSKNLIVQQPCLWHRSSLSCLASSLVSQSFSKAALIVEITPWYWAHLAAEHSTMRCSLPPSVEPWRHALSGFLAHVILSLFQGCRLLGHCLCSGLCLGFGLSLGLCLWLFQARPS